MSVRRADREAASIKSVRFKFLRKAFRQIVRNSQRIDRDHDDRILIVGADCQSLGPQLLADAFGCLRSAAESVQSNGIGGRDIGRGDSDGVLSHCPIISSTGQSCLHSDE